jgi:hypothetical protein
MGMWEHMKMGELPLHNALRFFCWGRSLKIRIEIKKELFMYGGIIYLGTCPMVPF